jgi:hypothetical protein
MIVVSVVCAACGSQMVRDRTIATVTHHYDPPQVTDLIRFVCPTPDCGTEAIVEGS